MIERLALPAWDAPPATLADWVAALADADAPAEVVRDAGEVWLEARPRRFRGFAVVEEGHVTAVNFEFHGEADAALAAVEAAARALRWEIHDNENGDDDEEEDE